MDKWVVRKAETADALIAAMEAGICRTNEDVEAIAESMGDTVRWRSEGIDTPLPPVALRLRRVWFRMKYAVKSRKEREDEAAF